MVQRLGQSGAPSPAIFSGIIFFHQIAVFFVAADEINFAAELGGGDLGARRLQGRADVPFAGQLGVGILEQQENRQEARISHRRDAEGAE